MPWHPELYPDDWTELEQSCKERAGWICEWCGIAHKSIRIGKKYKRPYTIILSAAHLNHDPSDNRDENLVALCQDCHLHHDIPQHVINCRRTKQRKRYNAQLSAGQLTLFGEKDIDEIE